MRKKQALLCVEINAESSVIPNESEHVPYCPQTVLPLPSGNVHNTHEYVPSECLTGTFVVPSQYFRHGPPLYEVYPGGHGIH
jgi:hypothetical protein